MLLAWNAAFCEVMETSQALDLLELVHSHKGRVVSTLRLVIKYGRGPGLKRGGFVLFADVTIYFFALSSGKRPYLRASLPWEDVVG